MISVCYSVLWTPTAAYHLKAPLIPPTLKSRQSPVPHFWKAASGEFAIRLCEASDLGVQPCRRFHTSPDLWAREGVIASQLQTHPMLCFWCWRQGSATHVSPLAKGFSLDSASQRHWRGPAWQEEGRDWLLSVCMQFLPALHQQGPCTSPRHGWPSPAFVHTSGISLTTPVRDVLDSQSVHSPWTVHISAPQLYPCRGWVPAPLTSEVLVTPSSPVAFLTPQGWLLPIAPISVELQGPLLAFSVPQHLFCQFLWSNSLSWNTWSLLCADWAPTGMNLVTSFWLEGDP